MTPFTAIKNPSPFHFTSLLIHFFTYLFKPSFHFTLLFISTTNFPSLFTFYRLHFHSLFFTSLTLVLKICILQWEVPVAPSGSWSQSVMDPFTKEYYPMSVLCFLALIFQSKANQNYTWGDVPLSVSHSCFDRITGMYNIHLNSTSGIYLRHRL